MPALTSGEISLLKVITRSTLAGIPVASRVGVLDSMARFGGGLGGRVVEGEVGVVVEVVVEIEVLVEVLVVVVVVVVSLATSVEVVHPAKNGIRKSRKIAR